MFFSSFQPFLVASLYSLSMNISGKFLEATSISMKILVSMRGGNVFEALRSQGFHAAPNIIFGPQVDRPCHK